MLKEIVTVPDEILKKISDPIEKVGINEKKLIDDLFETMYHSKGIGLAAVQVGILKRVLVVDVSNKDEKNQPIALINPVIKNLSEEETLARGGTKVQVQGASRTGRAVDPETDAVRPIETTGKEDVLLRGDKDIADEPPSILDSLISIFRKDSPKIPFPFTKRRNDIPTKIDDRPVWFLSRMLRGFQNNYEKDNCY